MPKKISSGEKRTEESFSENYGQYFFTSDPLHNVVKRLYLLGADVKFVEFLFALVRLADNLNGEIELPPKRPSVRKAKKSLPWPDFFRREYGNKALARWDEWERSREYSARQTEAALDKFIRHIENQERRLLSLEKIGRRSQVLKAILTQKNDKIKKGRKGDPAGTFFLFALSEHLREKSPRPHYLLCDQTLRKLRGNKLTSPIAEGRTAKVRVHQFKKNNPGCKKILKELKKEYKNLGPTHN